MIECIRGDYRHCGTAANLELIGTELTSARIAIVQGYVPAYRVAFFSGLAEKLGKSSIELKVIAGTPTGRLASRKDAVTVAPWLQYVEPHRVSVGGIAVPFYGTDRHWKDCGGVIFTLQANSLDLNIELLKKPLTHRRIGAWGHVAKHTKQENSVKLSVEKRKIRICDHIFAYTKTGAEFAVDLGATPEKVTAVMNSTDLSELFSEIGSLEEAAVQNFELQHRLRRGKTFGYIGALDWVKRIDFLAESLEILWRRDPQVKLVLGGRGDQESLLRAAISRGQVVSLGYAGPREKAIITRVSQALLHPGPIGLIAVECKALGMPILTTPCDNHGPEYEYLVEGEELFVIEGGPEQFADSVVSRTIRDGDRAFSIESYPTLDDMVTNFAEGIQKMIRQGS